MISVCAGLVAVDEESDVIRLVHYTTQNDVMITKEVVKEAARNSESGTEVMKLLLDRRGDYVAITEGMVRIIARSFHHEVLALFLDLRGDDVKITDEVVKAAAGNYQSGKEVIELLLDRQGHDVTITEEVVKAAAGNSKSGKEKEWFRLLPDHL
ncbi:hypothetical protein VE00_11121 [Pseudogymnoascus sp. WSF 3629]|nr:hypothetical protein VE00_11121 [Pseudogymnoascus sp. WSF 3629]